ncbi:flavin reductase (NADPH)-like isoform X1 [Oculina patagonica]
MAAAPGDSSPFKKLKLVVFGATGRTGNEVVKQALEKGHHVTAVVRTPEKLSTQRENLVLVKGDACDMESVAAALDGKDAVLSSLEVYANIFNPTTFYSESMNAITEAMSRHKITRLVTVTSWCTQPGPNNYWFLEWVIKPLFLNGVIKDMATMEKMLESSDSQALNYTIVRPCRLLVGEQTGNYKVEEGQCNTGTTNKITCADVAECMLKTLENCYGKTITEILLASMKGVQSIKITAVHSSLHV